MTLRDTIGDAVEEWKETDQIIDLTDTKTFIVASIIAIVAGLGIGIGYQIVFTSVDCSILHGVAYCKPNIFTEHKFTVFIVTLITGILIGVSPALVKHFLITESQEYGADCDDEDEE